MKAWSMALGAWSMVLASCVTDNYEAHAANGNWVKENYNSLAGTSSVKRSDGSSLVHDHQASWKDFMQFAGTAVAGLSTASVSKAKNASDAATAQQAQKQASDLAKQKEADAAAQALLDSQNKAAAQAAARAAAIPAKGG
jgi:hypothetical protein